MLVSRRTGLRSLQRLPFTRALQDEVQQSDKPVKIGIQAGTGGDIMSEKAPKAKKVFDPFGKFDPRSMAKSFERANLGWRQGASEDPYPEDRMAFNDYVDLLQREEDERLGKGGRRMMTGYNSLGLSIDGISVFQSILLFPYQCFLWNVQKFEAVTPDSLVMLELFHPRPSMLILGTDEKGPRVSKEVLQYLGSIGVSFEVMSMRSAASTYNVLCQDGRETALGIIIPGSSPMG